MEIVKKSTSCALMILSLLLVGCGPLDLADDTGEMLPALSAGGVTICSQTYYQGTCETIAASKPFADKYLNYRSIKVHSGTRARLCQYFGYQDCKTLWPGNYPDLKQQKIRSVELQSSSELKGAALVCKNKWLQAPCRYVHSSTLRLSGKWSDGSSMDNSIQSLMVRTGHQLKIHKSSRLQYGYMLAGAGWQNLPASWLAQASSLELRKPGVANLVHLCKGADFYGPCLSLPGRSYPMLHGTFFDGSKLNDAVKSIRIEKNYRVVVGQHAGLLGNLSHSPSPNTKGYLWKTLGPLAGTVSSLEVLDPGKSVSAVHVCKHASLMGPCKALPQGTYPSLSKVTFDDGTPLATNISSLSVRHLRQARVCSVKGFKSGCKVYGASGAGVWTLPTSLNDKLAAVEVQPRGAPLSALHICKNSNLDGPCLASNVPLLDMSIKWNDGSQVNDSISSLVLAGGHRLQLCEHEKFGGTCYSAAHDKTYYWNTLYYMGLMDKISTIDLARKVSLWTNWSQQDSYPSVDESCWSEEAQGIAHDASNWYVTSRTKLLKYPMSYGLANNTVSTAAYLPHGCNHFGDPDVHNGKVYAPLEGCPGGHRIYLYDSKLQLKKWAKVPDAGHAAWVAVNPVNGLIYSSRDYSTSKLQVYSADFASGTTLKLLYEISLPQEYTQIQGGAFSQNGTLYLVTDDCYTKSQAGIVVFFLLGTKATEERFIPIGDFNAWWGADSWPQKHRFQELEGITITNLSGQKSIGTPASQIHMVMLENEGDTDDVSVYHYSVNKPSGL